MEIYNKYIFPFQLKKVIQIRVQIPPTYFVFTIDYISILSKHDTWFGSS